MPLIDIIAGVLVLVYTVIGARHGLVGAVINFLGCIAGYVVCYVYGPAITRDAAARWTIPPIFAAAIVLPLTMLLVTRIFYLANLIVRKLLSLDAKKGTGTLLTADRIGGGLYGLVKGMVIVFVLLWALPIVLGSGALGRSIGLDQSQLAAFVRQSTEGVTRTVMSWVTGSDDSAGVIARVVANPREASQGACAVMASPAVKDLIAAPEIQSAARKGNIAGIVSSSRFDAVLADPQVQQGLRQMGFQPGASGPVERDQIARALTSFGGSLGNGMARFQRATSDPSVQEFLHSPQTRERLAKGDILGLMRDKRLAAILGLGSDTSGGTPPVAGTSH